MQSALYRNVYRDVVTMSGTHPALQLIKGWVERQQVDGKEAADIITAFPSHVFSPTIYLVQDFFVSIPSFLYNLFFGTFLGRALKNVFKIYFHPISELVESTYVNF